MAIILTSKFDPFTYDELVKPAKEMTEAHLQVEEALGELKAKSMEMLNLANAETDPIAHALYLRYANDLAMLATSLARSGLRPSSRRDLYDMAGRYQAEIYPILKASERREELAKELRQLKIQNPSLLFERDAANISLDDYIQNPNIDYGRFVSGDLLAKQVATAAEVLAKEARNSNEGKAKLKKTLLPYQYEYIKEYGFTKEAVMEAILRGPNADKILTGLVDDVVGASGVLDWGDADTINKAYLYAGLGLYKAIGTTNSLLVTDSYSALLAAAKKAAENEKKTSEETKVKNTLTGPRKVMTALEQDQLNKTIKYYTEKGFIISTSNGYEVTELGVLAYRNGKTIATTPQPMSEYGTYLIHPEMLGYGSPDHLFYKWILDSKPLKKEIINGITVYYTDEKPSFDIEGIREVINNQRIVRTYKSVDEYYKERLRNFKLVDIKDEEYKKKIESERQELSSVINTRYKDMSTGKDIRGNTEIYTPYNDSDGKLLQAELAGLSGNEFNVLQVGKDGAYSEIKSTIKRELLAKKGYTLKGIGSGLGNVMYITAPDNSVFVILRGNFGTLAEITYNLQVVNMLLALKVLDNPDKYTPEEVQAALEVIESGVAAEAADKAAMLRHSGIGNSSITVASKADNLDY